MVVKILILIVLVDICFQRCDSASVEPLLDEWDEVQALLDQLTVTLEQATTTSWLAIYNVDGEMFSHTYFTNRDALWEIGNNTETIRGQIQTLKQLADVLDRAYCLDDVEQTLEAASADLQAQTTQCIDHVRTESRNVISDLASYMTYTRDRRIELEEKFEQCPRQPEQTQCIVELRGQVQLAQMTLPTDVVDMAIDMMTHFRDWTTSVTTCAVDRTGLIFVEGNVLVSRVESCLTDAGN